MKSHLLTVLVFALSLSAARADWHNFRGPDGSGRDAEIERLPKTLGEDTLAWDVALPGRGLGSPILVGDKVFVTAASGVDQKQLHVLCFAADSGKPIWERRFWATGRTMAHEKTNVAAPTPASDGEFVYALFSSNDLICLDLEGNLIWMRGLTLDYPNASNSLGLASSPVVIGNTLVAQIENDSESFAAGFDTATGRNRWKLERPKLANWTSPTVIHTEAGPVAALQSSKGVLGVDPETGGTVFAFEGGASTIPSSAADGNRLYIPSNGLTAITASSGETEPAKEWNESTQRPGTASPLVIEDRVFVINNAGVLSCADRATGERLWRIRLDGKFSGSPVAGAEPRIYVFNEAGLGLVVDVSGEEGEITSRHDLDETILSTPALDEGALYIRGDDRLWKFAAE